MIMMRRSNMFREALNQLSKNENYLLLDENHPLELYGGYDSSGRKSIMLVTSCEVIKLRSTENIDVNVIGESNMKTIISLKNTSFDDQFIKIIEDMIEYSNVKKSENISIKLFFQRYYMWEHLFDKKSKLMSFEKIKGLFAELYFLNEFMFANYDMFSSIKAWLGPEKSKRDFELENYWYEIKSITSDSNEVMISSVHQLDDPIKGELVIVKLEKSNFVNEISLSLYHLVEMILQKVDDLTLKEELIRKLAEYGYTINDEYKEYIFHFIGFVNVVIDKNSNVLRSRNIPASISNVNYKLNYKMINKGEK